MTCTPADAPSTWILFKVIDIVYRYLYMNESTYRELMKRARNDLAIAVERRRRMLATLEATEKEIAQLKP